MACSLTPLGLNFSAATGAKVTVRIIADNTKIVRAEYNDLPIQVDNNMSATFTAATGRKLLLLNLAGPHEDVAIVEDCGTATPLPMGGYTNDAQPALGFTIIGT
jgi:hypothetical protein